MSEQRNQDLKIVVVDDSNISRQSIIETLKNNGFNVTGEAKSAEEAMPLLLSGNLFLIDVVMPEVSGLELARHMSEQSTKPINIIMMSSLNMEGMVVEAISNGAIDFLAKPFSEAELIQAVEKIEIEMEKEEG